METPQNSNDIENTPNRENSIQPLKDNPVIPESEGQIIFLSKCQLWGTFIVIALISTLVNIDSGIFPAATEELRIELHIDDTHVGMFGSADYVGRIIVNYWVIVITRILGGFSMVYYSILFPVWCDQFGSIKSSGLMLGIIQIGVPIGVVIGYCLCTLTKSWKFSLLIEGIILTVFSILVCFIPNFYFSNNIINMSKSTKHQQIHKDLIENNEKNKKVCLLDASSSSGNSPSQSINKFQSHICSNLNVFLSNIMIVTTLFAYAIKLYAVSAIKYWCPDYMETVLHYENANKRMIIFSVILTTGPVVGLLLGGMISKGIGGYQVKSCVLIVLIFETIASCLGIPSAFLEKDKFWVYVVLTWSFFLIGSSVIPLELGIIVSEVDVSKKGDLLSFTNFIANVLGNLPPPFIYGLIHDEFKSTKPHLAMQCVFYVRLTSIVALCIGTIYKYCHNTIQSNNNDTSGETNKNE